MNDTTLPGAELSLGDFLRDRRARLSPGPGAQGRRRTPGLRREEVATRAGVSVTWYTWLEQGRGGPPSDEVLERLARALELDAAGREVLFLLAQQRPPPLNSSADFRRLWAENDVRNHGAGLKRLRHPVVGPLTLEYSAFSVDGSDGLSMVVFTPATPADARVIELLLSRRASSD